MAEKKYYWLQLPTDFFKDRPLKKLKKMAGGAVYTIIYQKLLLLSLENEGYIYFDGIEDTFDEEMSLELDETLEDVQMTILFLIKNDLLEMKDEYTYFMNQVPEMIGSETDSARRKRKSRRNNKLKNGTMSQKSVTNSQNNGTLGDDVTKCPTEIEIEKEKDIYIEKEKEIKKDSTSVDYASILDTYNKVCINLPKAIKLTEKRKRLIRSFYKNNKFLNLMDYLEKVNSAKFLNGSSGWKADFDFIFKVDNVVKILEGKYDYDFKNEEAKKKQKPIQSQNYDQREYDKDYLNSLYDNEV